MDWQSQIITIYLIVCKLWDKGISVKAQRFSNNNKPAFTDQEVMTIYIFGVLNHNSNDKQIYQFSDQFLRGWFPELKGYDAFVYRLNRLGECFCVLAELVGENQEAKGFFPDWLIDSMPIVQAKNKRSSSAKVSNEISSKGYCASKGMYYYGVKLHVVGMSIPGQIPFPRIALLTTASEHDIKPLDYIESSLHNINLFADKAYCDETKEKRLCKERNIELYTPRKDIKGIKPLKSRDCYSTGVSQARQPIESFFSWLDAKTQIQNAAKPRSIKGLIVHVFGKLAAVMIALAFL